MVKMVLCEEWMWNIKMQMKMLIDQPNKPARDVVVIHHVDEIDIMEKLGIIAANANSKFQENESNK